jgi:hypothetical protein
VRRLVITVIAGVKGVTFGLAHRRAGRGGEIGGPLQRDRVFGLSFAPQLDPQRHLQQPELLLAGEVGRPRDATPKPSEEPTPLHHGRHRRGARGLALRTLPGRGPHGARRPITDRSLRWRSVGRECFQRAAHELRRSG